MDLSFARRNRVAGGRRELIDLLSHASSNQIGSATAVAQARAGRAAAGTPWSTPVVDALTARWTQRSAASGACFNALAAETLGTSRKQS